MFVAEAWVPPRAAGPLRAARRLHTAFNFDFLLGPVGAERRCGAVIDDTLAARRGRRARRPGCCPTTTCSGTSPGTAGRRRRWATASATRHLRAPLDLALGARRARAAALLLLALPGGAYVYQGEELGLPEVEDLPEEVLQDPIWERSGHTDRGRDGCRVPIPWSGDRAAVGFSPPDGADAWLPQPADWAALTVAARTGDPGSMLELYRAALRLRREHPRSATAGWPGCDVRAGGARLRPRARLPLRAELLDGRGPAPGGRVASCWRAPSCRTVASRRTPPPGSAPDPGAPAARWRNVIGNGA